MQNMREYYAKQVALVLLLKGNLFEGIYVEFFFGNFTYEIMYW